MHHRWDYARTKKFRGTIEVAERRAADGDGYEVDTAFLEHALVKGIRREYRRRTEEMRLAVQGSRSADRSSDRRPADGA